MGYPQFFNKTGADASKTETLSPQCKGHLTGLYVHWSDAAHAGDSVRLTFDANAGAAYDTLIYGVDMVGAQNHVIAFDPPFPFDYGDKINVAIVNAGTHTYGVRVAWEEAHHE